MATALRILRRGRSDERGVTLITFALSLVAICTVIALVLGGSLGYDAERNSQTSSDAAALAATSALREVQVNGAPASSVYDTAKAVAESNDSNTFGPNDCQLITANLTFVDYCSSASAAQFAAASGVRVGTAETRNVPFGDVSNMRTITGETGAAATIQPLGQGRAPFMVCSSAPAHPSPIIDASGNVIPAAIGQDYVLQGTAMKDGGRDCGNPAANWRGWVDFEETFPIPGFWGIENGNKNGHIDKQLVGPNACGGQAVDVNDFNGCIINVPLCLYGNSTPGGNFEVYCVTFGAFQIVHNGNGPSTCHSDPPQHICGRFIGAATAVGGQGTDEVAGANDVVVIKLVE